MFPAIVVQRLVRIYYSLTASADSYRWRKRFAKATSVSARGRDLAALGLIIIPAKGYFSFADEGLR